MGKIAAFYFANAYFCLPKGIIKYIFACRVLPLGGLSSTKLIVFSNHLYPTTLGDVAYEISEYRK